MKDKLERYIRDNRTELDYLEASDTIWQGISAKLEKTKGKSFSVGTKNNLQVHMNKKLWLYAAAVMTVLALSALVLRIYTLKNVQNKDSSFSAINDNYARLVFRYTFIIDEKKVQMEKIRTENPTLYHDFTSDFRLLEQNNLELRKQLPNTENKEVLIREIIKNLELQTGLLNQQLQIIKQFKKPQNGKPFSKSPARRALSSSENAPFNKPSNNTENNSSNEGIRI